MRSGKFAVKISGELWPRIKNPEQYASLHNVFLYLSCSRFCKFAKRFCYDYHEGLLRAVRVTSSMCLLSSITAHVVSKLGKLFPTAEKILHFSYR